MRSFDSFSAGARWHILASGVSCRTLKQNDINLGMVEKDVLSLLRVLDICYSRVGFARYLGLNTLFDVGLVSAILQSEGQIKKVGCVTIELSAGGEEMREG